MIDQFVVNDSINTTFYLKMHLKELKFNFADQFNNKNQRKFVFNKY